MPGSTQRIRGLFRLRSRGSAARSAARVAAAVGAVAVTSAALLASAASASASTDTQFWVATAGTATAANTSCATARYATVQSAVTAAEAFETAHHSARPVINLCPGTYQEQVTITKSLAITHAPGHGRVVIELPATPVVSTTNCQAKDTSSQTPQSVVEICGAAAGGANTHGVAVAISRVTVQGDWPADVCNDNLYGILVEGGASLFLTGSTVEHVGADPLTQAGGCQGGVDVDAGSSYTGQIGHAILSKDTIETYQKNGVVIDGSGFNGKRGQDHGDRRRGNPVHSPERCPDLDRCHRLGRGQRHLRQQLHGEGRSLVERDPGLRGWRQLQRG